MIKKRVVLSLLFDGSVFVNSRRFTLNKISELETLLQYLNFESIDELILLNVDRQVKNILNIIKVLRKISNDCFIPISCGGGISSFRDAQLLFDNGADKVVINSLFYINPSIVIEIVKCYGSQSVILSLDIKEVGGNFIGYYNNGSINSGRVLDNILSSIDKIGVGEILLRSIDNDGMASGYNLQLLRKFLKLTNTSVIVAGGVGTFEHIADGLRNGAQAACVGNLFHFVGERFQDLRINLQNGGDELPSMWKY